MSGVGDAYANLVQQLARERRIGAGVRVGHLDQCVNGTDAETRGLLVGKLAAPGHGDHRTTVRTTSHRGD